MLDQVKKSRFLPVLLDIESFALIKPTTQPDQRGNVPEPTFPVQVPCIACRLLAGYRCYPTRRAYYALSIEYPGFRDCNFRHTLIRLKIFLCYAMTFEQVFRLAAYDAVLRSSARFPSLPCSIPVVHTVPSSASSTLCRFRIYPTSTAIGQYHCARYSHTLYHKFHSIGRSP